MIRPGSVKDQVRSYVFHSEEDTYTPIQIYRAIDAKSGSSSVSRYLQELVKEGMLSTPGPGTYELTQEGKTARSQLKAFREYYRNGISAPAADVPPPERESQMIPLSIATAEANRIKRIVTKAMDHFSANPQQYDEGMAALSSIFQREGLETLEPRGRRTRSKVKP